MTRPSRKIRKLRLTEDMKLAKVILPAGQAKPGVFEAVDISNHSEADQRAMVRLRGGNAADRNCDTGRRTIRRRSRLGTAPMAKLLSDREINACEWYAAAYSARYETLGITANYAAVGGGRGGCNFDHGPKTKEQEQAVEHFDYARAGISPSVLELFEDVVLRCGLIGRRALAFKVAVLQLIARIEGKVEL